MSIRSGLTGPCLLVAMALGVNAPVGIPLPASLEPSAWARPPEEQPAQQQQQPRIRPNPKAGFLGAKFGPISDELAEQLKLDSQAGVVVMEVIPDSPAAKAQLQPADIIKTIDGKPTDDVPAFVMMMNDTKPDQVLKVGILREGKPMDVSVTLGKRPPMMEQMDRGPATAPTTRPGE